jgi:hypothetical protein
MKKWISLVFTLVTLSLSNTYVAASSLAFESVVQAFKEAQSNDELIEYAYELSEEYLEAHPKDGIAMIYKGSLATQVARDSLMPWNKLGYLREGIGLMDDGMDLLLRNNKLKGTKLEIQARMVRGITCIRIPAVFGRGSIARQDFKRIIANPQFSQMSKDNRALAYAWSAVTAERFDDAASVTRYLEKGRENNPATTDKIWDAR